MGLPSFIAIRHFEMDKHLSYVTEGSRRGYLEFSSEQILSPKAKFAVEPFSNHLVHIRCCYNNKYWCRASPSEYYMTVGASEPVEDKLAWNCTLFRPSVDVKSTGLSVSFTHVQTGNSVILEKIPGIDIGFFSVAPDTSSSAMAEGWLIDSGSIVQLPKYVAFEGDNRRILTSYDHRPLVSFSGFDPKYIGASFEVLTSSVPNIIRLMNRHIPPMYCRCEETNNLIRLEASASHNNDAYFEVIWVRDNVVALRNLGNRQFCTRNNRIGGVWDVLAATSTTITREAELKVIDLATSRTIQVQFQLEDARIYDIKSITLGTKNVVNESDNDQLSRSENTKYNYIEKTSLWGNTIIGATGVATTIKSGIPSLTADGSIQISSEVTEQYQWGTTKSYPKEEEEALYNVNVPPKNKATISVIAIQAKYDIPFSYVQTDTYPNDEPFTTTLHDGLYTGFDTYNVRVETTYEPL